MIEKVNDPADQGTSPVYFQFTPKTLGETYTVSAQIVSAGGNEVVATAQCKITVGTSSGTPASTGIGGGGNPNVTQPQSTSLLSILWNAVKGMFHIS